MKDFIPRLTAPAEDDPYYTTYSPYWQGHVGMPNCTAYSYGRINELKQVTSYADALTRTHLSRRNARKWWDENDGYARGQDPQVGAVAVFNGIARTPQGDTYGHVMVVEQVDGDTVTLSGSDAAVDGSSGRYFYVDTMTMDGLRDPSYHGGLIGFIYACPEFQETKESMSMEDAKKLVVCDFPQYLGHAVPPDMVESEAQHIVEDGLSTEDYDAEVMATPDFLQNHPHIENCDFVDRCYRAYLGRPASDEEQNFQAGAIERGEARYRDIAWNIYTSDEAKAYRGEA
jgi:surface antigen